MTNAARILGALDAHLSSEVELTLYGRAALVLGFPDSPVEYASSRDVDAVLWLGQAEELLERTDFWEAVERVNRELAEQELYVSHFFDEDQVVLTPGWRAQRVHLPGEWRHLDPWRLGNVDLLLSKLMRDDPVDHGDALFLVRAAGLGREEVENALQVARVPRSEEVREQFRLASDRLLAALPPR